MLAEAARRILNYEAIDSYSQAGEDRLIEQILLQFLGFENGYYVDVGANDPIIKSNTFRLYLRGWSGLAIDGNPALSARYKRIRPRDCTVCAVVSSSEIPAFFIISSDPALSHVLASDTTSHQTKSKHAVQTTTLGQIFMNANVPRRFELLTIDVEGADFDALKSFDISLYRPRLVVIEMHGFQISGPSDSPVYTYLLNAGYTMIAYAGRNGFFLDSSLP